MAESAGGSRGAVAGRGLALALIGGLALAVPDAARAGQIGGRVMLVNVKTEKCLTIAGGTSRANNVDSVQ